MVENTASLLLEKHGLLIFKLAVASSSNHIIISDTDGKIIFANEAAVQITGYSQEEIIGSTPKLWGGRMDKEFYKSLWHTIKQEKKTYRGEIKNKRKNGIEYLSRVCISPILDNKGLLIGFVGTEEDITREKEIDRMKTEFISLASHQLRTPLTAVKWYIEMLLHGDMGQLSEKQVKGVDIINQSNNRMISLVNSLLNLTRIESSRLVIDPQLIDLKKLIKELLRDTEQLIKEKKACVSFDFYLPVSHILLDPKLMHEIVLNLLSNAIKYTPIGGKIVLIVEGDLKNVIISVADNGYGIPQNQQSRVFEKFFRADNIVTKETDGSGLGLYFIKSVIDSSGGKIWFSSKENEGSTFWVQFPLTGMVPSVD